MKAKKIKKASKLEADVSATMPATLSSVSIANENRGGLLLEQIMEIAEEARTHPHRIILGRLAYDAFSQQGEGRTLFVAREHIQSKAESYKITHEQASSSLGNVLSILERGPTTSIERACVVAFAIIGFDDQLAVESSSIRSTILTRFVHHAAWFELNEIVPVYAFVDRILRQDHAREVWSALATELLLHEQSQESRARNLVLMSALSAAGQVAASARERLDAHLLDPLMRVMWESLRGRARQFTGIRGAWRSTTPGYGWFLVQLVTGFLLLKWLLRLAAWILRWRRTAEANLKDGQVSLNLNTYLLGRHLRETKSVIPILKVQCVARDTRYPRVYLLIGVLSLTLGVLFGGALAAEGLISSQSRWLIRGAGLVGLGAAIDLVCAVLFSIMRGKVDFLLWAEPKIAMRISGAQIQDVDQWILEFEKELKKPGTHA